MSNTTNYSQFIETALKQASGIALEHFGNVSQSVKSDDNNQVLTEADLAVGKYLIGQVRKQFPDHNIIDEEAGITDRGSRFTWVIDPIDGTSNFANGSPLYGILIGLLEGESPIAGGLALPSFQQVYSAMRGNGCFCNGQQVHMSTEKKLLNSLIAYGIDGHQENPSITHEETKLLADIILSCRNLRTSNSAFDMGQVASGVYGATLNRTSKIWDNVAQQIIIEEAGGIFTDFFGKPIDYSDPLTKVDTNFTSCAANSELHAQLQLIISHHAAARGY